MLYHFMQKARHMQLYALHPLRFRFNRISFYHTKVKKEIPKTFNSPHFGRKKIRNY